VQGDDRAVLSEREMVWIRHEGKSRIVFGAMGEDS
jgi:hypothetical protein